MLGYLTIGTIAAIVTAGVLPLVIRLGYRYEILAYPDGERRLHDRAVPQVGGIAMLIGVIAGFLVASRADQFREVFASSSEPVGVIVGAVVITLGSQGALYHDARQSVHVPVISAGPVVETTGAGDAFNGGFAVALSEGRDVIDAVRFGCATAGISVTRAGTAPSMPTRAEIDALLARQPQ